MGVFLFLGWLDCHTVFFMHTMNILHLAVLYNDIATVRLIWPI